MNFRSIHFRLITWYTGLIVLVALVFAAYIYQSVEQRLYTDMEATLTRRAQQIGSNILERVPSESPDEIARQIHDVYSPEANNRLIRILDGQQKVIYSSGMPKDASFDPQTVPFDVTAKATRILRKLPDDGKLLLVTLPVSANGEPYLIQMGMPTTEMEASLHGLIITLLYGLPGIVVVVSFGGYFLLRGALKPVENIRATAAHITFGNLSNRLPVSKSGDALEHLSVTLNQMLARLDDAYQQVSRFSADASHELRTPLTIMRGELESLVREDSIPESFRERVGSVLEETERLSRITENLFAISWLDAGGAKANHQKCDLGVLVQLTAEQMLLMAQEKSIELVITVSHRVIVYGDAARLKQVVVNLIDNAIKYTPEHGRIALDVKEADTMAVLQVKDNGVGIPDDALPYVFDRFYRADKARSRDLGGAGLGLSIVRAICNAHGGTVEVESVENKGSTFCVLLPLADATSPLQGAA